MNSKLLFVWIRINRIKILLVLFPILLTLSLVLIYECHRYYVYNSIINDLASENVIPWYPFSPQLEYVKYTSFDVVTVTKIKMNRKEFEDFVLSSKYKSNSLYGGVIESKYNIDDKIFPYQGANEYVRLDNSKYQENGVDRSQASWLDGYGYFLHKEYGYDPGPFQ